MFRLKFHLIYPVLSADYYLSFKRVFNSDFRAGNKFGISSVASAKKLTYERDFFPLTFFTYSIQISAARNK